MGTPVSQGGGSVSALSPINSEGRRSDRHDSFGGVGGLAASFVAEPEPYGDPRGVAVTVWRASLP